MDLESLSPVAEAPELFSARWCSHDDAEVLECHGELDLATASRFWAEVQRGLEERPPRLVIDLCGVGFMDASGLRAVLAATRRAELLGVDLQVACDVGGTLRLLEVTQTGPLLPVHRTRAGALGRHAP